MAIGKRNRTMMRKVLWKMNLSHSTGETGGSVARPLSLSLDTGEVLVRSDDQNNVWWRPVVGKLTKGN